MKKRDMKKRDLFVFAGQSNMMGAAVLPPVLPICAADSYEYKHKPKRLGAEHGEFAEAGYPCGEFSYTEEAFSEAYLPENTDDSGNSKLAKYTANIFFCPAMCNLKNAETHEQYSFDYFSESTFQSGPTLAPLFASEWEKRGEKCAYAHIAKGAVSINHYFNSNMIDEYNRKAEAYNIDAEEKLPTIGEKKPMWLGASAYFDRKVCDFFADASECFAGDDMSNKVLVWCQGEGDTVTPSDSYKLRMEVLWEHAKTLGFTHFFCVRVGNWRVTGDITRVMRAQENFCAENENCYVITRAMSFMLNPGVDKEGWFVQHPGEEYEDCRDSCFGFVNPHINEKGFALIAKRMADNTLRVLRQGEEPVLEKEMIAKMIGN